MICSIKKKGRTKLGESTAGFQDNRYNLENLSKRNNLKLTLKISIYEILVNKMI